MALERRLKILDCDTDPTSTDDTGLRVAFASTDMKTVNQHFGSARSFAIYAVDPEQIRMQEVVQFGGIPQDDNEDKLVFKLEVLDGCVAVYAQAIGASAVRQLKGIGVQPVKVSAGTEIELLLDAIQQELRSGPATWLARAIESQKPNHPHRFDDMEAEGWDE